MADITRGSRKRKASNPPKNNGSEISSGGVETAIGRSLEVPTTAVPAGSAVLPANQQNQADSPAADTESVTHTAEEVEVASILAAMGGADQSSTPNNDDNDPGNSNDSDNDAEDTEVPSGSDNEMPGDESEAPSSPDGSAWSFPESDGTNWNPMILRTSWAVPVGNTPYAGSPALITPRPEGSTTSMDQQINRIASLRTLLGEPSGLTQEELRAALEGTRWDMGSALRFLNHRFNEAGRRERASQPGRNSTQLERDRLLGAESLHHNRRRAVDALYQRLISAQPTAQSQLTTLNVGILVADARFDLEEAVNTFHERQLQPQQLQDAARRLRRLRIPGPNQVHQDERVALFMTIAGIDDYYAARTLMVTHNFDMGRVMDQWMQHGLRSAPNAAPPHVRRRATYHEPTLRHDDTENLWAADRLFGVPAPTTDAQDLLDAAENYDQGAYAGRNGYFVHFRRDPPLRVGVMNPSRMGLLWIRRGDFKLIWYGDQAPVEDSRRPGQPLRNGGTEPFDWNNPFHVGDLGGKRISQWFRRGEGTATKARGDAYQDDESEWLWNWHNDRLFEYMNAHLQFWNREAYPGTTGSWNGTWIWIRNQEWGRSVPYPIERLRRDFNHRFTTQIHLPGMNGQARQSRTASALDMIRRRIVAICEDFGFDYSPPHPTKESGANNDANEEDDNAGEGPSGTNTKKDKTTKRKSRDEGGDEDYDDDRTSAQPSPKKRKTGPKQKDKGKAAGKGKGKGKATAADNDSDSEEEDP